MKSAGQSLADYYPEPGSQPRKLCAGVAGSKVRRGEEARAGILAALDRGIDDEAALARIFERHTDADGDTSKNFRA